MGANAQTSVPTFTAGEVLTAANMNISARTGIPVFATTVTRDAAFGGTGEKTLAEGQFAYLEDSNTTQFYDGAAWQSVGAAPAWIDYTPTWTNLTVGNATQDFRYWQLGKFVCVQGSLTWGSTTSVTNTVAMSVPVTSITYENNQAFLGGATLFDATADWQEGFIFSDTSTRVRFRVAVASTTYVTTTSITNTLPFTWTTSDVISVNFIYEAA